MTTHLSEHLSERFDCEAGDASVNDTAKRRLFLTRLWKTFGLIAVLEYTGVLAAFLYPRRRNGASGAGVIDAGPTHEFRPESVKAFPLGKFYLVRLAQGGFLAISSQCTHLGCTLPWDEQTKTFSCPCHASAFDIRGDVLRPPASRALDLFAIKVESSMIKVDTSRLIQRARFEDSQLTKEAY